VEERREIRVQDMSPVQLEMMVSIISVRVDPTVDYALELGRCRF